MQTSHSFLKRQKKPPWVALLNFFFLIFRRIWKVSRRLRRHLHPPAETPESWPERPIFISSKDVHYALITSPRGWTFKTDTWVSQKFINSARIKNSTVLSSKTQFEVFCCTTWHIFRGFFRNQKLVIQCFALLFPRLFNFFAQFLHTKNNYFLTKKN